MPLLIWVPSTQFRMSSTAEIRNIPRHVPVLFRCHRWNWSSFCPTVSCFLLRCFASVYTQKVEDTMKMGEPLHCENPGKFSPPAEGHMAQEERTGGSAELPFKQTGLVSLPCRLFWLLSNHQNLKCNCSSGICLQVIPASRPYPPTCRHTCLRLQINPFIFT